MLAVSTSVSLFRSLLGFRVALFLVVGASLFVPRVRWLLDCYKSIGAVRALQKETRREGGKEGGKKLGECLFPSVRRRVSFGFCLVARARFP